MDFVWPFALLLALSVPAVLGAYLWKLHRRRKQAVTYSSVALLRSVIPRSSRWRRHLPVGLLLTSLGVLAVASARPQMTRSVPIARTSIILALDVSRSMCSSDVKPNRFTVAQQAASAFIEKQAKGTRTGLVVFSGFAQLVVPPTTDRKVLLEAVDGLSTGRGTAIGSAMLKGLDAIAEVNPDVAPIGDPPAGDVGQAGANGFVPDIVVLLTDGANNRGITPLDAVPYAVERRVRVYTIGFGTAEPAPLVCSAQQLGGGGDGAFGGGRGFDGRGGFGGGRSPLRADHVTLQEVADRTGGAHYSAEDADQLRKVFADLPKDVDSQKEQREVTSLFAALGAILAGAAIFLSLRWSPYP